MNNVKKVFGGWQGLWDRTKIWSDADLLAEWQRIRRKQKPRYRSVLVKDLTAGDEFVISSEPGAIYQITECLGIKHIKIMVGYSEPIGFVRFNVYNWNVLSLNRILIRHETNSRLPSNTEVWKVII